MSDHLRRSQGQRFNRGAAKISAPTSVLDRSKVNWDYLRVFVTVAEAQSFRAAAVALGIDPATVSRRIKVLEDSLGSPLILKSPDGIHLTDLGTRIFHRAHDLARAVADIERKAQVVGFEMSGRVRMSLTEGLGVYWILPRLVEIQRSHPMLTFDVKCSMELSNTLSIETDFAVQFNRPRAADVTAVRLGALHVLPFASKCYLERFGVPRTLAELAHHKHITQSAKQGTGEDTFLQVLNVTRPEGLISFRSESSVAQYTLVKMGAGIGFLPSYAACVDRSLVPIEIEGVRGALDIWLVFHPQVKDVPYVAAAIEWVRDVFDRKRFPWFRDEYVPTAELAALPNDDWKVNMLDEG